MTLTTWTSQSAGWDAAPASPPSPAADHAVLGEFVIDQVRPAVAALHDLIGDGKTPDPAQVATVLRGLSYGELRGALLLAVDCADAEKITQACLTPRTAEEILEDYSWLRDDGSIPDVAAKRCGVKSQQRRSEYETRYQAMRQARRGGCAA